MTITSIKGLTAEDRKALSVFTKNLRDDLGGRVRRIVLYGSKARGEGFPDSDIDVLVVVDRETAHAHDAISGAAYEAAVHSQSFVAPYTVTEAYWRKLLRRQTFFSRNLERDGVEITG